jgi:hypothetical protein
MVFAAAEGVAGVARVDAERGLVDRRREDEAQPDAERQQGREDVR